MPKVFQKYFIAIVPDGEVQKKATDLKLQLKEKFGLKYALKSPAHITLKMPFSWDEAKELRLVSALEKFFKDQSGFGLVLRGIGNFGKRVIYVKVRKQPQLHRLQDELAQTCRKQLNLTPELSDYAYHPHMTLAFKDLKSSLFEEYYAYLDSIGFKDDMLVKEVALLKRENGRWAVCHCFALSDVHQGPSNLKSS